VTPGATWKSTTALFVFGISTVPHSSLVSRFVLVSLIINTTSNSNNDNNENNENNDNNDKNDNKDNNNNIAHGFVKNSHGAHGG
jgi:hypothetical protein